MSIPEVGPFVTGQSGEFPDYLSKAAIDRRFADQHGGTPCPECGAQVLSDSEAFHKAWHDRPMIWGGERHTCRGEFFCKTCGSRVPNDGTSVQWTWTGTKWEQVPVPEGTPTEPPR